MLQTANVLKSNFTQPIGCRVLAVKCSKNDHLNLEECTSRQLTRMMDLMPSDFAAVNSTLLACAMIPNQQNFTRHDERFNFSTIFSGCQTGQVHVTFKSDQLHWYSSWSSFLTESCKSLEYFFCFHRTLGISPKDFKADIASHDPGDLNFDFTFVTRNFIGSSVIRCAFWLVGKMIV